MNNKDICILILFYYEQNIVEFRKLLKLFKCAVLAKKPYRAITQKKNNIIMYLLVYLNIENSKHVIIGLFFCII